MSSMDRIPRLMAEALAWGRQARPKLRAAHSRVMEGDVQVFGLEGLVRGRVPARVLYAGRSSLVTAVSKFLFSGSITVRPMGRATAFDLHHRLETMCSPSVDLLMWEVWPWETSEEDGSSYVVQTWLDARANPGTDFDTFMARQVNDAVPRAIRKARSWNVEFELTSERARLEQYYHEMVLPSAQARFGEASHVQDLGSFLSPWAGAELLLLLLKEDGVAVAGQTLVISPRLRELAATACGEVARVREDRSRNGAASALIMEWVFREACRRGMKVNLASTRPFLDDGVLQYKRQWGCHFQPTAMFPRYRMQFVSRSAADLLMAAPFLHVAADGIRGECGHVPQPGTDPVQALSLRLKPAVFDGLRRITVHVAGDATLARQLGQALPSVKGCPLVYVPTGDCAQSVPLVPHLAQEGMASHANVSA